ncbi:MAG: helix-turn-helix domain-containing protein [Desulfobacterota bacterium]|nr:helix-turn-helix domain-containing protein [Thermodesulfobacteriota bacterium]
MVKESGTKTGPGPGKAHRSTRRTTAQVPDEERSFLLQVAALAARAFQLAAKAGGTSIEVGKALIVSSSGDTKLMRESGAYLKDLRELAGLTQAELADALHMSDQSLLAAVEKGTATLSFELILRLAALLARHDPVPFIIKFTRTYNPEIWAILEKWGVGRIPVHFERERQFVNVYRAHDAARKLTDKGFDQVLQFTRSAFEMALHFVSEQQHRDVRAGRDGKAKKRPARNARKKGPA